MYSYQEKSGSSPRFFLYYYSDSDKELRPGVPSRVSGSKDTSTNMVILLISGLQPEEAADNYCAIAHGIGSNIHYPQCLR